MIEAIWKNFTSQLYQQGAFEASDMDLVKPALKVRRIAKNDFFITEGQVAKEMAFVHQGLLRMYYTHDEKEVNTYFFFENEFATSFQSFLSQQPSRYIVQAMEETTLVSFNYKDVQKAYDASHRWERFGRLVSEQCYLDASERNENFQLLSAENRYHYAMAKFPQLFSRVPLYHIASYMGMERETLSRLRAKKTTV